MPKEVARNELRRLVAEGAQLVEVLPSPEFEEAQQRFENSADDFLRFGQSPISAPELRLQLEHWLAANNRKAFMWSKDVPTTGSP